MVKFSSAHMSSAEEARFRIQAQPPTGRVVKVIDLDSATSQDIERLVDEVADADLVAMIVAAGGDPHGVATIGKACSARRVMTHTFVVRARSATDEALSTTLALVRPWSLMVVVVDDDDGVDDMLRSFR
jgi:hypothetical protein